MKKSKKEIELKHEATELYNIVLNIEDYPNYIPWCSQIEIISRKKNTIKANMTVNYKFFPTQEFVSNVEYDNNKKIIKTNYIKGPLKNLNTRWKFKKLGKEKTKVEFTIGFEFKNFFHQKIAELFFPLIEVKMMDSFIERADKILN